MKHTRNMTCIVEILFGSGIVYLEFSLM